MKMSRRSDVYIHVFFTSALVEGEWSASCPGHFTLGGKAPSTDCVGGWVCLRRKEKALEHTETRTPTPHSSSL
jgi:hypothetical protein